MLVAFPRQPWLHERA